MANPKKIADKGSALTCDEYDDNLDILQDRANHVGTQSCSTISDLDSCLSTSSVITGLEDNIDDNTNRIIDIEKDLSASGGIAQDISNLEATLRADIIQNTQDIQRVENRIDLELIPDIAANSSEIASVSNTFTNITDSSNTKIAALELWRSTDEPKIDNSINRLTTLENVTIPAETLARQQAISNLDQDVIINDQNRIQEDSRLESLINDEVLDRRQDVDTVDSKYTIITDALRRDIDNEIDDREDADSLLQAQINTLNSGLSGAIPTATILAFAGFNAPPGFLMCRGQSVDRSTYSALFSIISTRYGSSSTSTFNVPDMRSRTLYGSNTVNLNTVSPEMGQNTRVILESEMPRHEHSIDLDNHQHTVDYTHFHHLYVHPHNHINSNLPEHTHSLDPYRPVALGGGSEDSAGAELTAVEADSPSPAARNIPANTSGLTSAVPGPSMNEVTVGIYPPPFQGINRTDDGGGLVASSPSKSPNTTTGGRGGTGAFDVRQAGIRVNFIIKT